MVAYTSDDVDRALAMVRAACLRLPETNERQSHGGPAFFVGDKTCFVMFLDDHHDDGWLGVHLLTVDAQELDAIVLDAFRTVAPAAVLRRLDPTP